MNTIPGYCNLTHSVIMNAILTVLILSAGTSGNAFGQQESVQMMVSRKIHIPHTADSVTFNKDSVYQVLEQIKTGKNAAIDRIFLINHQGKKYVISSVNFKPEETVNTKAGVSDLEGTDLSGTKFIELTDQLNKQTLEIDHLNSNLIIFETATGVLGLLAVVASFLFFRFSTRLKTVVENTVIVQWSKYFKDISSFSDTFEIDEQSLQSLNPHADLKGLISGDELVLKERSHYESGPKIQMESVFERAFLRAKPAILEAVQNELANGTGHSSFRISESEFRQMANAKDALLEEKKLADGRVTQLKDELNVLKNKLQAESASEKALSILQKEFIDVSANTTLVQFAAHAKKLLGTLTEVRKKTLEFADFRSLNADPFVCNLVAALFVKSQNEFQLVKVQNWSTVINEINDTQRIYTDAFLKGYQFETLTDSRLANEFMRTARKELFRDYLSQNLILCETLSKLSLFEGVSRQLAADSEAVFKNLVKTLLQEAALTNLKVQYIALGTSDDEVERLIGHDWERVTEAEWPFDKIAIGKNRVKQILSLGYDDTPGILDSKTKIVLDV
ncbi:hypothetical protein [Dyadobacter diqingensis]|uniref:hypothetical protein n=1 Tax=Dyadobacter diqingensis TaxID=2938121 RepID=UPI0020C1AB54|nr:hypothetical protein [Dyadobacter diqingensis]